MELHKAIKQLIESYGVDILNDNRLLNILGDYKAFEEVPASKYILRDIVAEGAIKRLSGCSHDNIELTIKNLSSDIVKKYGYIPSLVIYNLKCIAFALEQTTIEPTLPKSETSYNQINEITDHISFKGVSFSENIKEFVKKLLESGLTIDERYKKLLDKSINKPEGFYIELKGSFAGVYGCRITIGTTWLTHSVYHVSVLFPWFEKDTINRYDWERIKARYFQLKDSLAEKYGQPLSFDEITVDEPVLDGFENDMEEIECLFKLKNGSIQLSWLGVFYEDKANSELNKREESSDL